MPGEGVGRLVNNLVNGNITLMLVNIITLSSQPLPGSKLAPQRLSSLPGRGLRKHSLHSSPRGGRQEQQLFWARSSTLGGRLCFESGSSHTLRHVYVRTHTPTHSHAHNRAALSKLLTDQ